MTTLSSRPATTVATGSPLLNAGLIAGPMFVVVAAAQVATRAGFDPAVHPLSALSLGEAGWIQIANFVLSGLLAVVFAVGLRQRLSDGPAAKAGPIALMLYGVGLVGAGIFRADAAYGFPEGAPAGMPETFTVQGMLHGLSAFIAFISLAVACFAFARRFSAAGRRGWAGYSIATGILAPLMVIPFSPDGASIRMIIGTLLAWAWFTALATNIRTHAA